MDTTQRDNPDPSSCSLHNDIATDQSINEDAAEIKSQDFVT